MSNNEVERCFWVMHMQIRTNTGKLTGLRDDGKVHNSACAVVTWEHFTVSSASLFIPIRLFGSFVDKLSGKIYVVFRSEPFVNASARRPIGRAAARPCRLNRVMHLRTTDTCM